MADPDPVSEAVVCWTSWKRKSWPQRDEQALVEQFGQDTARDLLPLVKALEEDFYRSEARHRAATLKEMGDEAASEFRLRHPEISEDAVQALTWCYTYDYK